MNQQSQSGSEAGREQKRVALDRSGGGIGGWLLLLVVIVAVAGGGYFYLPQMLALTTSPSSDRGVLTHVVTKGRLLVTVTEDGNVESARNLDVKAQVAGGSTILWIIPDGTEVEQGAELVKLDQSNIEEQLNAQTISFEKAQALKIQAEEDFEAAKISVREYEEGTFLKEQKLAESQIRIALENLRSAENLLSHTQRMARKGFATPLQAEADAFAVERAKLDLEAAQTAKRVLVEFTRAKMLKDLEAKRETAAAKVRSEIAAFDLEQKRLDRLQAQLKNSVIKAPQRGMVVYANDLDAGRRGGSSSVKVEEGAPVREGQTLIRLPDLTDMQVKVIVHESKVELIKRGMPARIEVGDRHLSGSVISVANQPEPGSWMSSNVKEYAAIVKIEGEMKGLKPGMTAEVEILIDDLSDVPLIPVSAVVEQRGKFYAWVKTSGVPERRQLKLGRTNDKSLHVIDGVKEGDEVLLNPRAAVPEAREEGPASEEEDPGSKFKSNGASAAKKDPTVSDAKTEKPEQPAGSSGGEEKKKSPRAGGFNLMAYDKDGDKKVSREEAEAGGVAADRLDGMFNFMDTNKDGFIDAAELAAARKNIPQGGGGRPAGAGGAGGPGGTAGGAP
jgi:multidrug resistance efflux pump